MISPQYVFPSLLVRTPLFSFAEHGPGDLQRAIAHPWFRAAIFVASPEFYTQLDSKGFDLCRMNEKEQLSLWKYLNRMSFRPTPFGLFSAFTMAEWGDRGPLVLDDGATKVHILPDQELAGRLAAALAPELLTGSYRLNPTLYQLGREFRFIKTFTGDRPGPLSYSLESLEANALTKELKRLFGQSSKTGAEITRFLEQTTNCSGEDAPKYLNFLRQAGVVYSVLDPNITGPDHLARVARLPGLARPQLRELASEFAELTESSPDTGPDRLPGLGQRLKTALASHGVAEPGKYFYVNTERAVASGAVPAEYQQKLLAALGALGRLVPGADLPLLSRFERDFQQRFDMARVPLLQAMDPDAGLGYGHFAEHNAAEGLLKNLTFPQKAQGQKSIEWSAVHRLLMDKWNGSNGGPIRLGAADLETLPQDAPPCYPPSLSVMFRITEEGILIESAGGVTATALIGRFTMFSDEVWRAGKAIAALEKRVNADVIFAEIGQLSDVHADNINRRMPVYDYEIPINSVSLLPETNQVALGDLVVSVRAGQVILESMRLGKRVIPRLSSAYNFQHNHLAVFRFLCDLQYQSLRSSFSFDLENYFPGMSAYPRVEYEGAVLSPAKWHIKPRAGAQQPAELRAKLGLPARVALTRFDQQLVFDLDEPEQIRLFSGCVRGMEAFTLQEFFLPPVNDTPVVSASGRPLINQMIALLVNSESVYAAPAPFDQPPGDVQRVFVPGSQWLYLKIYCTPQAANDILKGQILPLITGLLREQPASWFFIRYQDPGPHIRLRIKVAEHRAGQVLAGLKMRLAGLVSDHIVREYQVDTYRREIERYGAGMIGSAEDFFRASSDLAIHFLKRSPQQTGSADKLAISGMAGLLEEVLPVLDERLRFLEAVTGGFYREFNGNKNFRVELDALYRNLKAVFLADVNEVSLYRALKLTRYNNKFKIAARALFSKKDLSEQKRHSLLADVIHMHLNRIYADRQREREAVLYHCFLKYTISAAAIRKHSAGPVGLVTG